MYARGDGVPENDVEAVKWYRKAAEQGDDGAQYNLGNMYYKGEGVRKDSVEAYALYSLAAGIQRLGKTLTWSKRCQIECVDVVSIHLSLNGWNLDSVSFF